MAEHVNINLSYRFQLRALSIRSISSFHLGYPTDDKGMLNAACLAYERSVRHESPVSDNNLSPIRQSIPMDIGHTRNRAKRTRDLDIWIIFRILDLRGGKRVHHSRHPLPNPHNLRADLDGLDVRSWRVQGTDRRLESLVGGPSFEG